MASDKTNPLLLKFLPFRSFINNEFWHKYAEIKLEIDGLNENGRPISAVMPMKVGNFVSVELACNSFNANYTDDIVHAFRCKGTLLNYNTLESFKNCNKKDLLKIQATQFYQDLLKKETIQSSSELMHFFLLSFSDLKTYKFFYWFAFPAPTKLLYEYDNDQLELTSSNDTLRLCINEFLFQKHAPNEPFFIYHNDSIKHLSDYIQHRNLDSNFQDVDMENLYFCFYDPTGHMHSTPVSWHVRQLLAYIMITCPRLSNRGTKWIRIAGATTQDLKFTGMTIHLPSFVSDLDSVTDWVGWEVNEQGRYMPRFASLMETMSPECLAESSINLNLKLMKWRLVPSMDLQANSRAKCLLLGAGTLGCNVARSLMAWGITKITIVDCGRVSLSNPVRQSLYRYDDAINGGKPKASTASERLKEINPSANIVGVDLKIPMPGHQIGEGSLNEETKSALSKLTGLIQEHDFIYLLTDSRESRWLPTMLGAFFGKFVINAALGFDSYLVMRHGCVGTSEANQFKTKSVIPETCPVGFRKINGSDLGCYFCNDIVAPGNSMKDRTLDQQCTVTRPAVSNMASGLAVEMMISLIQHGNAPAYYRIPKMDPLDQEQEPEGILGIMPHSIRGNISTFQTMITATERYSHCVACSNAVLERYASERDNFIINVLNGVESLDTIAGLDQMFSSIDDGNDLEAACDVGSDISDDS